MVVFLSEPMRYSNKCWTGWTRDYCTPAKSIWLLGDWERVPGQSVRYSLLSETTYCQISKCLQGQIWLCAVYCLKQVNSAHVGRPNVWGGAQDDVLALSRLTWRQEVKSPEQADNRLKCSAAYSLLLGFYFITRNSID